MPVNYDVPTTWAEVFQYTWLAGGDTIFVPYEKNGFLWYYITDKETGREEHTRWISLSAYTPTNLFGNFKIIGPSPKSNWHGPVQPPLSPLILKIRQMEKRFNQSRQHA